jgi:pimeloyl-ACP methyl ester carboxylesterase
MAEPLTSRYRIIAPDLRGSGASHDPGPLSFDQLADDLAALLDHLGVASAVVGGLSFGAACAVRFALRHRERVTALAVIMPAFAGADLAPNEAQRTALAAMAETGARTLRDGVGALLPLFDALPIEIRERARSLVLEFDPASVAATTAFLASGARPFDHARELAAIDVPVLVVPGTDPSHPREVALIYAEHVPRARLIDAAVADHARVLGEFLDAL